MKSLIFGKDISNKELKVAIERLEIRFNTCGPNGRNFVTRAVCEHKFLNFCPELKSAYLRKSSPWMSSLPL